TAAEVAQVAPRVVQNLEAMLEILARHGARATLFFLGEVPQSAPQLVRAAQQAGHEIGCHGMHHRPVALRTVAEFRDDVQRARAILEDVARARVVRVRAPCFLRGPADLWQLDVLAECGFRYDSSYMPLDYRGGAAHLLGGGRAPVCLTSGLWEFPLPLSRVPRGHLVPCAAGGFALRALPFAFTRHYLARFNREIGPAVVYTHPWEIDPESPKLPGTAAYVRFFNGVGRRRMPRHIARLLREFRVAPLAEVYAAELAASPSGGRSGEHGGVAVSPPAAR